MVAMWPLTSSVARATDKITNYAHVCILLGTYIAG